ncbi:MAG: XdhC family protein [Candidatus Promineifilaceae bacterium]
MKEIAETITEWMAGGQERIAIATVITTWGSAPRRPGAKMAVNGDGQMVGSVSGGCVEGAVVEAASETLGSGKPQLLHFGVADETAWQVGLACGGSIDVFVECLDRDLFSLVGEALAGQESADIYTVIDGDEELLGQKLVVVEGASAGGNMEDTLREQVLGSKQSSAYAHVMPFGEDGRVFADPIRPAPTLVAVGGVDIAIALTKMARIAGYQTIVVDPRRAFSDADRFPHVDQLIQQWPRNAFASIKLTPDTAVALLTHDPKIDDPALELLLKSDVFYIGALGSPKTHQRRLERLEAMGFTVEETQRIHAPIGLEIGADNPQEIAVAILAEILSVRHAVPRARERISQQ